MTFTTIISAAVCFSVFVSSQVAIQEAKSASNFNSQRESLLGKISYVLNTITITREDIESLEFWNHEVYVGDKRQLEDIENVLKSLEVPITGNVNDPNFQAIQEKVDQSVKQLKTLKSDLDKREHPFFSDKIEDDESIEEKTEIFDIAVDDDQILGDKYITIMMHVVSDSSIIPDDRVHDFTEEITRLHRKRWEMKKLLNKIHDDQRALKDKVSLKMLQKLLDRQRGILEGYQYIENNLDAAEGTTTVKPYWTEIDFLVLDIKASYEEQEKFLKLAEKQLYTLTTSFKREKSKFIKKSQLKLVEGLKAVQEMLPALKEEGEGYYKQVNTALRYNSSEEAFLKQCLENVKNVTEKVVKVIEDIKVMNMDFKDPEFRGTPSTNMFGSIDYDDSSGNNTTGFLDQPKGKIIVSVAVIGTILLIVIAVCCCLKGKKDDEDEDDSDTEDEKSKEAEENGDGDKAADKDMNEEKLSTITNHHSYKSLQNVQNAANISGTAAATAAATGESIPHNVQTTMLQGNPNSGSPQQQQSQNNNNFIHSTPKDDIRMIGNIHSIHDIYLPEKKLSKGSMTLNLNYVGEAKHSPPSYKTASKLHASPSMRQHPIISSDRMNMPPQMQQNQVPQTTNHQHLHNMGGSIQNQNMHSPQIPTVPVSQLYRRPPTVSRPPSVHSRISISRDESKPTHGKRNSPAKSPMNFGLKDQFSHPVNNNGGSPGTRFGNPAGLDDRQGHQVSYSQQPRIPMHDSPILPQSQIQQTKVLPDQTTLLNFTAVSSVNSQLHVEHHSDETLKEIEENERWNALMDDLEHLNPSLYNFGVKK